MIVGAYLQDYDPGQLAPQKLALTVLKTAIDDLLGVKTSLLTKAARRGAEANAREFIFSAESQLLLEFWCTSAGVEVDVFRQAVLEKLIKGEAMKQPRKGTKTWKVWEALCQSDVALEAADVTKKAGVTEEFSGAILSQLAKKGVIGRNFVQGRYLYFAPPDSEKKAPKEKKENAPKEKKENAPANGERPKTQGFKSPSPMRARKIGKKPVGPYVTEGFLLPGTSKNFERILSEIKRLGEEVTGLRQLNNEMLDHEAMLEDQLASSRDQIKDLEAKLKASEEQLLYKAEQVVEEKKISEAVENIDKALKKFNGLQPIHASGIKDRLLKEQLQATGWGYWKRDNGGTGHLVFAHPKTGATVAIPHHPSRDISSVMRSHLMKRINLGSKLA